MLRPMSTAFNVPWVTEHTRSLMLLYKKIYCNKTTNVTYLYTCLYIKHNHDAQSSPQGGPKTAHMPFCQQIFQHLLKY